MNSQEYEDLRERFRRIFQAKWDPSELMRQDELKEKFAFHMADAAANLVAFARLLDGSSECDLKRLLEQTEMLFYDCMPHLVAAAQIYDDIPHIFPEQDGVHDWNSFVDDESPN